MTKLQFSLFLIPLFLIMSCTKDSLITDDYDLQNNTEIIKRLNDVDVAESGGDDNSICVDLCNLDAEDCYNWAEHLRDGHLLSCEINLRVGTILVDVYCTQQVVGWIEEVPVYSPEGELIRIDEVIHYIDEEYVCGQEEQYVLSTDPDDLQEYEECKNQALTEFVEAIDKCDIKKSSCLKKCKKGPIDEL